MRNFSLLPAIALVAGHAAGIAAQPDAGALQQQIESERRPALPPSAIPVTPSEPALQKTSPGGVVTVKAFQFAGNTLLSSEALAREVASYLNRPLQFAELQQAAAAVANAYRQAGWLVRAYLPEQDVSSGTVTIQIVEAVFGGAQPAGDPPLRVRMAQLLGTIDAAQPKGAPLNADKLDRALLLLDDLPGVAVSGSLQKGLGENETALVLKAADEPLLRGEVGLDNAGSRSTGQERLTGTLFVNSPLGIGDQVAANLIHTLGSDYGWMAYSAPLGSDGWRIGVSASQLHYKLVADDFMGLDAHGTASTLGLDANYPLIRSRLQNLYLGISFTQRTFDNQANGSTSSRYGIDNLALSLNGNLFDKLGGGGANAAGVTLTQGDVNLGTIDTAETAQLNGGFSKLNYYLSRQQVVTDRVSAYAAFSGQAADKNLDSAEKFYLGGAKGVRAYPANEGGGADGQMVTIELRWRLPQNLILTGFYDWGSVRVNRDNTANANPNSISLKGAGLSLAWQAGFGLNLKATWARRIGDNPNPTATGRDQDGSLDKNRIWLTASLPF
jgi:hemolysin activation/secretion protein